MRDLPSFALMDLILPTIKKKHPSLNLTKYRQHRLAKKKKMCLKSKNSSIV
jgi:hypothetical protein